jgi:hypothetical protein
MLGDTSVIGHVQLDSMKFMCLSLNGVFLVKMTGAGGETFGQIE